MAGLDVAPDTSAAGWIVAALETFGQTVVGLVPNRFQIYVRVFHPAYRLDWKSPTAWKDARRVSWAEIAAANGTIPHPGMQLPAITGHSRFVNEGQPDVYDRAPLTGSLPPELAPELVEVLSRHTRTANDCWFAIWNGFGAMPDDVRQAPLFDLPTRRYYLLRGALGAAGESIFNEPHRRSPNIWWPDDLAWCVATEVDLNTTYIGCSEPCSDDLTSSTLEALRIDPSTGITWNSDDVNPDAQPSSHERP